MGRFLISHGRTNARHLKELRQGADRFIRNPNVRQDILKKCNYQCVQCGSGERLQFDHIISVYLAHKHEEFEKILNTKENLQILCATCNASKRPEYIPDNFTLHLGD